MVGVQSSALPLRKRPRLPHRILEVLPRVGPAGVPTRSGESLRIYPSRIHNLPLW